MGLVKKNCLAVILILIFIHLVLGLSLIFTLQHNFIRNEEKQLIRQCQLLSESYTQIYESDMYNNKSNFEKFANEVEAVDMYSDLNFSMVDMYFKVLVAADNSVLNPGDELEDPDLKNVLNDKIVISKNSMRNIFDEQVLSIAYPLKIWDGVVGALIVSKPLTIIQNSIKQITTLIVACLILSCILSAFVMSRITRKILIPVEKISSTANHFAQGNFDKRINFKSNDEIGSLVESLNHMADRLEDQEKIRTRLISNISHDLRSPLTSISGFLTAIRDGIVKEEKRDYYIDIIYTETCRLRKLVNNILDITKIKNHEVKLNKTPNDINELIEQITLTISQRLEEKNITLEKNFESEKCVALFDYDKIQRVLYNLIDNAYKFTPENGKITITIGPGRLKNKYYISIKDSGIGIKKEEQPNIFERFYKSDASRSMDKTGSGLGLSIVKEFVNEHGEELELYSEQGEGCEFVFTLERAPEEQTEEQQ